MGYAAEVAATDKNGADGISEIVHGINVGGQVGPVGHGAHGGEKSGEKHQAHHEEPHDQHGLLHGVAIVGNDKAEAAEKQRQEDGQQIDKPEWPLARSIE